jgi:Tol biopolymer transport system component
MTTTTAPGVAPRAESKLAAASPRFDAVYTLLASFFVVGLYVDGWAHNHGRVDESFFTPWHAIFYSGFALVAFFLLGRMVLNRRRGLSRRGSIPLGYEFSLIGVFVFGFGGVGDLIWHTLFGIEEDVEALLSPTHLLLVIGMVLIAAGPFRSASLRGENGGRWQVILPAVVSVLLVWSVISFITQFAHPFLQPWAAIDVSGQEMQGELFVMNADGSGQTRLTNTPDVFETHPSFSPDGRQVVYAAETEDGYEIFTMNLDGSSRQQLTHNQTTDWGPAWSTDGNWIAYSSEEAGPASIFVMSAEGGEARQLTSEGAEDWGATWSPDSSQIAFQRSGGGVQDIWRVNLDGSGLENLTGDEWNGFHPAWSPDGSAIAFVSNASGTLHIYSLDPDTRAVEQVTFVDGYQWNPVWSPDGSQIAYVSDATGDDDIYVVSVAGGEPVNLTSMAAFSDGFPRWSPDGSQIIYRVRGISSGGWFAETSQALGIATVILQSALLAGAVLLLVQRFELPFGVFTLLFTLNAFGMTLMDDEFRFIPAALLAGLAADVLVRWIGQDREGRLYAFAFLVPLAYTGLYFATLFLTDEVVWTIHFWAGAIVLAGLTGFLAAYLGRQGQAFRPA